MPRVTTISGEVKDIAGGLDTFEVEATTMRGLIRELEARFPGLGELVEEKMSVAVDGEIHQDAMGLVFAADSELVLVPKISGG